MRTKIFIFSSIFLLSLFFILLIDTEQLSVLLEKLIFNAVSILVGLSIAVVGIFLGAINNIYLSIYKMIKVKKNEEFDDNEIKRIKEGLGEIVSELKDNTLFTVFCFFVILILFFLKVVDIPYVHWFIDNDILSKISFINFFILNGTFLIFYAIVDSLLVVFKITDAFQLIREEN